MTTKQTTEREALKQRRLEQGRLDWLEGRPRPTYPRHIDYAAGWDEAKAEHEAEKAIDPTWRDARFYAVSCPITGGSYRGHRIAGSNFTERSAQIGRIVDSILAVTHSLEGVAGFFESDFAKDLRPSEIALVALTLSDMMRGGKIGDELASPEALFDAIRIQAIGPTPDHCDDCGVDTDETPDLDLEVHPESAELFCRHCRKAHAQQAEAYALERAEAQREDESEDQHEAARQATIENQRGTAPEGGGVVS